ncbi:hypothetical protein J4479_05500 [Candidatus Woesearchaeota archaeon]|nr:hypothetical protein [Candidatus Woesearchaeota archaeon]
MVAQVDQRREITQVINRVKVKKASEREGMLEKGLLAVTVDEQKTLENAGVKAVISLLQENGWLKDSIGKAVAQFSAALKKITSSNLSVKAVAEKDAQTQMATIKAIISKGGEAIKIMEDNLNKLIDQEDALLVLVRRSVRGGNVRRSEMRSEDLLTTKELQDVTRTSQRFLRRKIKPLTTKLADHYRSMSKVFLTNLEILWKNRNNQKGYSPSTLISLSNRWRKGINDLLMEAERTYVVDEEEKKYLHIIEGLAMKLTSPSALAYKHKAPSPFARIMQNRPRKVYGAQLKAGLADSFLR